MGWLLKFLLIFILGSWLLRSVIRGILGRAVSQAQQRQFQQQRQQQQSQRRRSSNINVDTNPRSRKNKTSDDYKGGDYIDYEEVE